MASVTRPSEAEHRATRRVKDGKDGEVKSALRAVELLELLTFAERPLSFGQIGDALGYPRSSLHGLLGTLVRRGWVETADGGSYALGIRAWEAGHSYMRVQPLAERARRYMERVRDELNETVQMAILDGRWNVYIAKVDGTQQLALQSEVGRRLQAHATGLGKALLAGLDAPQVDSLFEGVKLERFTPATIASKEELHRELARVRLRGYATDEEEYTPGVRCVAAPVLDHEGRVVAAMSVSVPTVRFRGTVRSRARALIVAAAADLSAALGFRPDSRGVSR